MNPLKFFKNHIPFQNSFYRLSNVVNGTRHIKLIHGWGSKKRKKVYRTFMGLFSTNNIYLKQNLVRKIE
jgi:hypothetical protein